MKRTSFKVMVLKNKIIDLIIFKSNGYAPLKEKELF